MAKAKKGGRVRIPVKRNINLAVVDEQKVNMKIGIPAILLIVAAAFLISKFAVADRFIAVSQAQHEVYELQRQVDEGYRRLDEFGELQEKYAHYTFADMTAEEISRVDRADVLRLIRVNIIEKMPTVELTSWNVSSNTLTLNVTAGSLQEINEAVQQLESDELVSYCTVTTAKTDSEIITAGSGGGGEEGEEIDVSVSGRIVAYLVAAENEVIGR